MKIFLNANARDDHMDKGDHIIAFETDGHASESSEGVM